MITPGRAQLIEVLEEARSSGFLGPGPVEAHIDHAMGFMVVADPPRLAVDLGSGAGVPGLVLALLGWPDTRWCLVDSAQRRCTQLTEAVEQLDLSDRVEVRWGRAEEFGRLLDLRGTCDLVTARGFASPAVTAECGAPLLTVGGHLIVSEPPGGAPERWPADGMAELNLKRVELPPATEPAMAVFELTAPCGDRYPRRVGIPTKRPLF